MTHHLSINLEGARNDRRTWLKKMLLGGGAALTGLLQHPDCALAAPKLAKSPEDSTANLRAPGEPLPKIRGVKVIDVAGGGVHDVTIVKVTTDQPGLYGYGCASIAMPGGRSKLVRAVVEHYLSPFVAGRAVDRIEQIWQLCYQSSYYKNDHVQNTAIGGLCDALWDIKGRQAGMPVYQLVGGKCRDAAEVYMHAEMGNDDSGRELLENTRSLIAKGYQNVLIAMGRRHGTIKNLYGESRFDDGSLVFNRDLEIRKVLAALEVFRTEIPSNVGLGVDVHSLLDPPRAAQFGKDLERFRLFYCEDLLSTDDQMFYSNVRRHCTTPLAMGELWNNPHEWRPLIEERLIDYIRHHVSHIGGFTAARKVAILAENFGIKFAWHGGPNSPIGHMTNLTLDLTHPNFGIHEHFEYPPLIQDIFHGCLQIRNGYAYVSEKPGWGIEVDEVLAAKHPIIKERPSEFRTPDGSVISGTG